MSAVRDRLVAFFAAENARDWERYAEFLHPDVEWLIDGRSVRGKAAYVEAMVAACARSNTRFRLHQLIESSDATRVATLLVDGEGHRSLDIFEFDGGLIRREWEVLLGPGRDWSGADVTERPGEPHSAGGRHPAPRRGTP